MRTLGSTRAAIVLTVALLAGCGSDPEERLSRGELVEKGNKICRGHVAAISRLEKGIDPTDDQARNALADFARVLPQVADEFRGLADDLRDLRPPESMEQQFDVTMDRIDRVADEIEQAADKARAGDVQGFRAVLRESAAAKSTERFFRQNGFTECS